MDVNIICPVCKHPNVARGKPFPTNCFLCGAELRPHRRMASKFKRAFARWVWTLLLAIAFASAIGYLILL